MTSERVIFVSPAGVGGYHRGMAAPPGAFSTFLRVLNEDTVEEEEEEAEVAPAATRAPARKASSKAAAKRRADNAKK